ncbi:alpha/beta hydrolase [Campylobacter sp. LR264d]|uniref:alpha/beta fold hydrolase n=1 Tax=Campylobacter sp. LR264d TaxID=2593544 RepID=UPI00123A323B|nr:alpha/beta hydrolase [Campylobacter sp. LR264d]KAA6229482.1 alpha/beta hydrolase [Campylobacter sp. LR264d]
MASTSILYNNHIYNLSYELKNPNQEKKILILHGWGANKELMQQAFSKYLKDYTHIYLDLPGFGKSNVAEIIVSKDYVNIINEFLKSKKFDIDIFIGHSYGGKIATLLCKENQKLILLSSAGIVVKKSLKVRLKIKIFKFLKKLGFSHFYKFFVSKDGANLSPLMYEIFKKIVDENFEDFFKNQKAITLIFWGKYDKATPLSSGEKIHSLIKNSTFYALEGDHFFFLKEGKFISDKIRGL